MQYEFQLGSTALIPISVRDSAYGQAINADALPTVSAMTVNGNGVDPADATYSVAIAQAQDNVPANIAGEYVLTFDSSAFAKGDAIVFYLQAVVAGTTISTVKSAKIDDDPGKRPVID